MTKRIVDDDVVRLKSESLNAVSFDEMKLVRCSTATWFVVVLFFFFFFSVKCGMIK